MADAAGKRPAVFLDRDGVINATIFRDGKPRAPDRVEDFVFLPGVEDAVARLRGAGFAIVVVTNQPDVARGWQTRERVDAMNALVCERLAVDALKVCFHDTADGCACRKPLPGMLHEAARELGLDVADSYMVGDREGDVEAGRAAGCRASILIRVDASEERDRSFRENPEFDSLRDAADWILGRSL
jgi:D-glycero-D-manno-heptose 1,7-bisphosphate phosphatase